MATQLQLQLQPWLNVLKRARLTVMTPSWSTVSATDTQRPWVRIAAPANRDTNVDDAEWLLIWEAMEIFDLLARVNSPLAWYLLTDNRRLSSSTAWARARYKDIQGRPGFKLGMDGCALLGCEKTTFKGLNKILSIAPMDHSATYDQIKTLLLAKWAEGHDGQAFDREKEGYVDVYLKFKLLHVDGYSETAIDRVLSQIEILAQSCRSRVVSISCETSPFILGSLAFGSPRSAVPTRLLASVNRISQMGIPVATVDLYALDCDQLDPQVLDDLMETQVASQYGTGLPKLSIGTSDCDVDSLEALCSAIAHSKSLRRVECGTNTWSGGDPDEDEFTRRLWLVYALFSPDASHDIHTVGLNMEIFHDVRCVDAMRSILSSQDPLARLIQYVDDRSADLGGLSISAAAVAVLKPATVVNRGRYTNEIDDEDVVSVRPGVAYRVVYKYLADDAIEILIPHVGVCWCKSSDVLEMRPRTLRETHSVRNLRLLYVDRDTVAPTNAFLELIGGPLEHLTVFDSAVGGVESLRFFDTVLTHCPKLKRLDLQWGEIGDLHELCNRKTNLESLYLEEVKLPDAKSLERLLNALGDPTQPLAQSLRVLHIDFYTVNNVPESVLRPSTFQSFLVMLDQNHRLERCELKYQLAEATASWKSQFLEHDGEPIEGRLGPLPRAETLAFLSVATPEEPTTATTKKPKTEAGDGSARHKLDVDTLRLILELAALPLRRICTIVGEAKTQLALAS